MAVLGKISTTDIDLTSDAMAANPWPHLRALREQGPLIWHEKYNRWIVTSDRAVRKILSNFTRFTVEGTTMQELFGADAFISIDERKRHDELRNIWVDAFRKQGLDDLQADMGHIVANLVTPMAHRLQDGETVDAVPAICRPLPTMVIALMMGVPESAIPDVVRWSDAMASGGTTYLSNDEIEKQRQIHQDAKDSLASFLADLLHEKRANPGEDLVSLLAISEPAQRLPDEQLIQNLRQLLFAGNETTAKWLGHLFVTYAENCAVRTELITNRNLIPAANDEVMRWQAVVGSVVRNVRGGAIDVVGTTLADGDQITCLLGSANRDPARYPEPDMLDIHREALPNIGFGVGFHNCLGSVLAKVEVETAMNAVFNAMPDFHLTETPRYSSLQLRGPLQVLLAKGG